MANYYAEPSDIAAEGYYRNMAAHDQRNELARRRKQEEAQRIAQDAVDMMAGGEAEATIGAYMQAESARVGLPYSPQVLSMVKGRYNQIQTDQTIPSDVRRWEYYNNLPPSDQQRFLQLQRAGNMVDMGGGGVAYRDAAGGVETVVPPEVATKRNVTQAGQIAGQQEQARQEETIAAIPARSRAEIDAAVAKASSESQQNAERALPAAIDKANQAISVIDQLVNHPGLPYIVGAASLLPIVPATEQANADAFMKQIEGQAFLEAFATLKGGGQITQIEGEKATQALLRLSRKQDKEAFIQSMNELRGVLEKGLERARKSAAPKDPLSGLQQNLGSQLSTSVDLPIGTVDGGYEFLGGDPSRPESWKKVQ